MGMRCRRVNISWLRSGRTRGLVAASVTAMYFSKIGLSSYKFVELGLYFSVHQYFDYNIH